MKNLILKIILSLSVFVTKAQSIDINPKGTTIYNRVDIQPEYPGGFKALQNYLNSNIKPGDNKGMVVALFIIERDGKVSKIKIVKPLSQSADKEAIRLIAGFPKFKPAIKDHKVVRCTFTMPIRLPKL